MSRKNSIGDVLNNMSRESSIGSNELLGEMDVTSTFTISPSDDHIPEIPSMGVAIIHNKEKRRNNVMSSSSSIYENKSNWRSFVDAADEFGNDGKRLYKFFKRRLSSKKSKKETEVKAIHIVPDEEENSKWASRLATSSAHSRSSTGTGTSSAESKDEDGIETVHDMDDEYNVFHGC